MSGEDREHYKNLKKTKKRDELNELFTQLLAKSHINFKSLLLDNEEIIQNTAKDIFEEYEDDFEDYFATSGDF